MSTKFNNPELVLVTHSSKHHADRSGMKCLAPYLSRIVIDDSQKDVLSYRLRKAISGNNKLGYNSSSVSKEIHVILRMIKHTSGVVHFLNGESQYRYSGLIANKFNWYTCATFHKPCSILLDAVPHTRYLSRLDAVFCVGSSQIDFFKAFLPSEIVRLVPHGVDTEFFTPTLNVENIIPDRIILFVGQHMRDFKLLKNIIRILRGKISFRFIAVIRHDYREMLSGIQDVEIYSGISDLELRNLYQTSSVCLIPLLDTTANNSVLEALACGVPIVTNKVGSILDYVDEQCSLVSTSSDAEEMANAVMRLLEDVALNRTMRNSAREKSLSFSWNRISDRYLQEYKEVFGLDFSKK